MDKHFLEECIRVEVIGGKDKKFSWLRAIRHAWRQPHRRFLFWWRILSYMNATSGELGQKFAKFFHRRLSRKYGTDISLYAQIQPGLHIAHYNAIVITSHCKIGKNFRIRQSTTIGTKTQGMHKEDYDINIGDNVYVGANCCIIADHIHIGNNVKIGAMSLVNKDIPDNSIYYQKITPVISTSISD